MSSAEVEPNKEHYPTQLLHQRIANMVPSFRAKPWGGVQDRKKKLPQVTEEPQSSKWSSTIIVRYIQEQLDKLPDLSEECCIYSVPKLLRSVNPEAYTPMIVDIGPLHQKHYGEDCSSADAPDLFRNGLYKLKCLKSFLEDSELDLDLESCLNIVTSKISDIRACYEDSLKIFDHDGIFSEMILLDSVFIIQFLRHNTRKWEKMDPIWRAPLKRKEIGRDIMLAENQLPLFILEDLYALAFPQPQPDASKNFPFTQLVSGYFTNNMSLIEVDMPVPCHLLDWFRISLLPITKRNDDEPINETSIQLNDPSYLRPNMKNNSYVTKDRLEITCPTATALYESGIKFEVNKDALGLLDIHFDTGKGILLIPKLKVDDDTECRFRNMIAFEKCHNQRGGSHITDYQFFMDCLITTPMDVLLLSKAGIIENWLGSEKKLSDLINSMGQHAYDFSQGYMYKDITEQLNIYHAKKWNRYVAILKHVYFVHPWAIVPIVYALLLLLLTIIQTSGTIKDLAAKSCN